MGYVRSRPGSYTVVQKRGGTGTGPGAAGNLDETEGQAWIERLVAIKPAAVQLYTLARGTPSTELVAAPETALRRLAEDARAKGVPVGIFL